MTSAGIPLFERPFYFLRHGESESNRLKIVAGSIDVALTDLGRAQAKEAIEALRPLGVTQVTSSRLRRARDTATIIARALALPHVVLPDLAERNWGELEGKPLAQRVRNAPPPPGAETVEEFVARVRGALAQVRADGVPLLVAHSGTHRVLCRLLGLPELADAISNCCPVRYAPPARPGGAWSVHIV